MSKYALLKTRCLQAMSSDDVSQWRNVSVEPQMLHSLLDEIDNNEVAFSGAVEQMKHKDREIQGLKDRLRAMEFALRKVPGSTPEDRHSSDLTMRLEDWHRVRKPDGLAFSPEYKKPFNPLEGGVATRDDLHQRGILRIAEELHMHHNGASDPLPQSTIDIYVEYLEHKLLNWIPTLGDIQVQMYDRAVRHVLIHALKPITNRLYKP